MIPRIYTLRFFKLFCFYFIDFIDFIDFSKNVHFVKKIEMIFRINDKSILLNRLILILILSKHHLSTYTDRQKLFVVSG